MEAEFLACRPTPRRLAESEAKGRSVLTSEGVSLSVLTSGGRGPERAAKAAGRSVLLFFAVVAEEAFQFLGEFVAGGQVAGALVQLRVVAFF
jgi:hypothetical protein